MKKGIVLIFIFFLFINNIKASSIVMDMDNKRILYENNINEQKLIASTTKIMTAILAIESNRLEEIVTVGEEVLTMYGSNIYISLNEQMLLLDLVYGLMLQSGNDASVAIAKFVGGTEENFVKMMNNKAKELGMNNTIYNNPHGLDEETQNYSTVYDLCTLYSYAYKNKMFKTIVGTKYYNVSSSLKSYKWINKNNLLFTYDYATGGKTGYTPKAGRILVSSASDNDINLCIATIDSNSYLYNFHEEKYKYIFTNYKKYQILDKNNISIVGIDKKVYLDHDFYYTLTKEEKNNIVIKTNITKKAFLKDKDIIGQIYVYLNDKTIQKEDIYVKVEKRSKTNKIKEFFQKLLSFS